MLKVIKRPLERVYNLLDHLLYADTKEVLEAKIESLELERDNLVDANDELMITIEDYKEEVSNLKSRRWIS